MLNIQRYKINKAIKTDNKKQNLIIKIYSI